MAAASSFAVAVALFCLLAAQGCRGCFFFLPAIFCPPPATAPTPAPPTPPPYTPSPSPSPGSGGGTSYNGTNVGWIAARATWYGAPNGAGPEDNGGACGFKNVNLPPFSAMTSCGNEPLFKDGKGCGSCYQVRTPPLTD